MKKSTKIILITFIICIASMLITWGEVALILLVVKWAGLQFSFFKWSVILTVIVIFLKGIFKSNSKK
jgi:hypothetical protein